MSTRNRTPPLLEPYLRLPTPGSQLLLTGVLDSSPQWLVTRLLRSAFTPTEDSQPSEEQDVTVVLVSWMRDFEFWRSEARRGAGIDLARLAQQDKFVFVDGLTHLFPAPQQQTQPPPTQPSKTVHLKDSSISSTHSSLTSLLTTLSSSHPSRRIHLILDAPTLLLSTSSSPSASALSSLLLSLRSLVSTTTLVLEADFPFLAAALPDLQHKATPLEAAHAAFVVQQAHISTWVLSLRPLDTGKARDVSGVIRVSRGGAWDDDVEDEVKEQERKELEALYFVQNDGGVRVFERGEASVG
ncbi:uncharacterized protein M437DRAFT_57359 [Aureobasidium melanogenum CBS 110374]|uniref:Elongator complex protein 5 n=1 Tax=Aureobasidium melanogenum (strain CBS 110374) TaxID=1043003 RepID=A0A074VEL5_AURM1|nr:uncharacterized protein M437DRAFT_57359 [Aureobasidium melanogenum CBS 110374]KEQ59170.1 hypothetical protein M437DRAFT_57359 [Aureobasidium melanogenum CBS 110374]